MTAEQLWQQFQDQNPALCGEGKCEMTKANVKRMAILAFNTGLEEGKKRERHIHDPLGKHFGNPNAESILRKVFG
jgi:hypothetical protein